MLSKQTPVTHIYKVSKVTQQTTEYTNLEVLNGKKLLTDIIRIEQFRNLSKATGIDLYFRLRDTTNWQTSAKITGLWKTQNSNLFFGDCYKKGVIHNNSKTLILFEFNNSTDTLKIYVFKDFYPNNQVTRIQFINQFAKSINQ